MIGWIILFTILIMVTLIACLLSFPFILKAQGSIKIDDSDYSIMVKILIGSNTFGIGYQYMPGKHFILGPFAKPWIKIRSKARQTSVQVESNVLNYFSAASKKYQYFPFKRFFHSIFKSITWERCDLSGKIGFPNPMHTGFFYGLIYSARGMIPGSKIDLAINPLFSIPSNSAAAPQTDLTGTISIKFIPWVLLWKTSRIYIKFKS